MHTVGTIRYSVVDPIIMFRTPDERTHAASEQDLVDAGIALSLPGFSRVEIDGGSVNAKEVATMLDALRYPYDTYSGDWMLDSLNGIDSQGGWKP